MSKIVALEITPQAIRAAEVAGYKSKKPKLIRTGEIKLEEEVAGESSVIDVELLAAALKQLWAESKFSTKSVGLIVSGRRFIVRPHTTSHTSPEALRRILPFEAPGAFPDQDIRDLLYDFYPTYSTGGRTDGLVVSSPSEPISELALALSRAKLELEYVDFAPLAVTRWLYRNREEENYALVNIRDESTDIAVVEYAMPKMIRVVSKGLNSSRRRLHRKGSPGELLRRDVLVEGGIRVLVQDIGMTIRSQTQEGDNELECIFLSGPRAEEPELIAMLKENFGIPVIPISIESPPLEEDHENNLKPSLDGFVAMCGGMR